MNIFEDLIEELKEENLLEQTVIETHKNDEKPDETEDFSDEEEILLDKNEVDETESVVEEIEPEEAVSEEPFLELNDEPLKTGEDVEDSEAVELAETEAEEFEETVEENVSEAEESVDENVSEAEETVNENLSEADEPVVENAPVKSAEAETAEPETPAVNGVEFYRQRAMKEVSGLQMVEHVFSGIERDQMKILPKPYDDLEAKKILHSFLQVSGDLNSPEHAQAEFKLMQETESWYSALSHRDKSISVTHLRRFCETSRPVLSSQALISLARFYRNSPYSEPIRSKFDLIITRLFAKEIGESIRKMVFEREEMIKHLTTLYAEWSSVPLYAANEDDSEILLMTLKFEDFMTEADNADSFDELIKNDFFNRLRIFKESTNENFFAPLLTATAIECNVRVGNRYVELLHVEREKSDGEKLRDRYGFLHDQSISEAASMSLHLVDLLEQRAEREEAMLHEEPEIEIEVVEEDKPVEKAPTAKVEKEPKKKKGKKALFAVNKWLLLATIIVVVGNLALYIWFKYSSQEENLTKNVKSVNLENTNLKEFIREGRIANDTFFGVVQLTWPNLSEEKRTEVLRKIHSTGVDKGFSKVHLLDSQGRSVGYADAEKVDLY